MRFDKTGELRGTATLTVDGADVGSGEIKSTARYMVGWLGLTVGRDQLSPVSWDYPRGFPFTGEIDRVISNLADDAPPAYREPID